MNTYFLPEDLSYRLGVVDPFAGNKVTTIFRLTDGAAIPMDPRNQDYQQYLAWLADGNEPLPAGE